MISKVQGISRRSQKLVEISELIWILLSKRKSTMRFHQIFVAFSKYLNFHNLIYLDWAIVSQIEGNPVWGKAPWGKALWACGKPFCGKGCWNCPEVWPSKTARVITGIHIFKSFFLRPDLLDPKSKIKLRRKSWLGCTQRGTKMAAEFWSVLKASTA